MQTPELPFDADALANLAAVVDRIIPTDEWPSATQNGCFGFLAKLFEERSDLVDAYRIGLASFRADRYSSMSAEEQDRYIERREKEPFMQLLIQHAMEGYYSDPSNGGNAERSSWKMIGFEVSD
jgi:gluconate 2-dehydrogenase gamma chain